MKFERIADGCAIVDGITLGQGQLRVLDLLRQEEEEGQTVIKISMKLPRHSMSDYHLYELLEKWERLGWVMHQIIPVNINGMSTQKKVWTLTPALREAMTIESAPT